MKKIKYWFPPIIWAGLIFYMSSRSNIHTVDVYWQDFVIKKIAHFTEYFIFTVLVYRALSNTTNLSKKKSLVISFIITVVYAVSDELHQSFIPGREPRVRDVFIDASGSAFALFMFDKMLYTKFHHA